jgi:tetratricopeptide (TPR) repeat protein
MNPFTRLSGWLVLLAVGLAAVGGAGCSRSPEARKARHLERGDKFFQRDAHREAVIEYANVLRIEPGNAHAIRRLGLSYFQVGEFARAYRLLQQTLEKDPADLDARTKLGQIYLLGRRPEEARAEALAVLDKQPRNLDALALLAGAADEPAEIDDALKRFEAARGDLEGQPRFHMSLGTLAMRKGDQAGAERAFTEAIKRDPKAPEAHAALASFYIQKGDRAQAEREFKAAADLTPPGSAAQIRLADFYVTTGRREEAKALLRGITEKAPDALPAWRRLAEIALNERQYDQAANALQVIFKKAPSDVEGLLVQGRLHLAQRKTNEALQSLQKAVKLEPRLLPARYTLAQAHLQAGNVQQAKSELQEALNVSPGYVPATLLLAQLNIQTGARPVAIDALETLLKRQPRIPQAYVLLGAAYIGQRQPDRALQAYRKLAEIVPRDPRAPYLAGVALRQQGKPAEAAREFEAALAIAPAAMEPLAQLAALDIERKQPQAALERVTRAIAGPAAKSASHHELLGRVHLARQDRRQAEAALEKAIELDARLPGPYVLLARMYAADKKFDDALARLDKAVGATAGPRSVGPLMLTGAIHQAKGDIPKAQQTYEKILGIVPRFAPAANNLAYLYSEHGGDQEKALQLAQLAKEVAPEDPYVSDTLGWILYKRGVYQRALSLLEESAGKVPQHPEVQYHLGMTYLKVGDTQKARRALEQAVASPAAFAGKDDARKALAGLK